MNKVRATRARTETFNVALLRIAYGIVTSPKFFKRGAIPKNSPNKRNAWRLLKILLSDEIQGNPDTLFAVDPVRKSAVPLFLNHWNSDGWVEENIPGLKEILLDFDRAHLHQPLISQYVRDSMLSYVTGTKTFEDCYKKLLNTLELYKDE